MTQISSRIEKLMAWNMNDCGLHLSFTTTDRLNLIKASELTEVWLLRLTQACASLLDFISVMMHC